MAALAAVWELRALVYVPAPNCTCTAHSVDYTTDNSFDKTVVVHSAAPRTDTRRVGSDNSDTAYVVLQKADMTLLTASSTTSCIHNNSDHVARDTGISSVILHLFVRSRSRISILKFVLGMRDASEARADLAQRGEGGAACGEP